MIIFLKNRIPEMRKKGLLIKSSSLHLKIHGNSFFKLNSTSKELENHKGTQEKSYLSVLSVRSAILLDVRRKSIVHKTRSCGPHFSILPILNTNLRN